MKKSKVEVAFDVFNYLFLLFMILSCLIPFLTVMAKSVSSELSIMRGDVFIRPIGFTTLAYEAVFQNSAFINAFFFTVRLTALGTATNIFMTTLAAFPLSRKRLPGKKYIWIFILITMFISGGMIPTYLLVSELNLLNNIWALILPGAISTYNMIIMKTAFDGLPVELEESARLDGCSEMRFLRSIAIPLTLPTIAALTLFYCVGHWNQFMQALLYMNDGAKYTLQLRLRSMIPTDQSLLSQEGLMSLELPKESLKAAAVIFATVPILVVYPWLQKYFTKGVMIGAVKG